MVSKEFKENYKVGDYVSAFHPQMFGVVKDAQIKGIGEFMVHLDFGLWGIHYILPEYVAGHITDWRN